MCILYPHFRINSFSSGGLINNQPELFLKKYVRKTHGTGMFRASDITGTLNFFFQTTQTI